MDVEFTARQGKITKTLRTQAEEGLERIGTLLGNSAHASVTLSAERHLQVVELKIQARARKITATGKAESLAAALRQAIEHAENQARRYRDRRIGIKRLPKEEKLLAAPPVTRSKTRASVNEDEPKAIKSRGRTAIPVHSFPAREAVVEPHILSSSEAIALRPMTVEEAVKEAEFRDKDLLVFHTKAGAMFVLHRRRDGQMELVEMP